MANWDHLTNIGTHPVLDPDPAVSLPAKIEAARRNRDKFQAALDDLEARYAEFNNPPLAPGLYYVTYDSQVLRSVLDEGTVASRVGSNGGGVTNYFIVEGL